MDQLELNIQSLKTELKQYKDKPYKCLFEYIWNSFDAGASNIKLSYNTPNQGIGSVSNIKISDNGNGWDFSNINTKTFLSSTKSDAKEKNKSLPMGQFGRGRYAFIWIAEEIQITSKNQRITLKHNTEIDTPVQIENGIGTEIDFIGAYSILSDSLTSYEELGNQLLTEFGWFLTQNQSYSIDVNGSPIQENQIIKEEIKLVKDDFPEELREEIDNNIEVRIVLWSEKPREFSKFYFLDNNGKEIYKENSGLNKKNDNFWHSVYVTSSLFKISESKDDENKEQKSFDFGDKKKSRLQRKVKDFLKSYLINVIRKPYLTEQSEYLLQDLKAENLIPELSEFGIYDEESYDDLIKAIYTISPSLFSGKSDSEKRFICATFAGLLSNQDDILIVKLLEQLQELTAEEQKDLLDILNRTSLSNVVKTIKEIDHRLDVTDKLKVLISEHEKETLEVKHIQKILDDNFWLFGEQFRLFSSTEGALKKVLLNYAKEVLEIEDPELVGSPTGEVDLFLTKNESIGEAKQLNVIIELKRASKKLGKTQYDQIESYMESIRKESLCNGENQYWEFYLIGKDYDSHIEDKIDSAKNHGQKDRGLCYNIKDGKFKIYVRKWSDILEVEWGTKMKYLKEKLEIQSKQKKSTSDEIISDILSNE
jgi:hypothetical protein